MKLALISCVITALAALSLNAEAARFVRFEVNGTTSYGEVVGDKIHQLSGLYFNAPERTGVTYDYDAVKLLLPLAPRDVSKSWEPLSTQSDRIFHCLRTHIQGGSPNSPPLSTRVARVSCSRQRQAT